MSSGNLNSIKICTEDGKDGDVSTLDQSMYIQLKEIVGALSLQYKLIRYGLTNML